MKRLKTAMIVGCYVASGGDASTTSPAIKKNIMISVFQSKGVKWIAAGWSAFILGMSFLFPFVFSSANCRELDLVRE
jgi:hypothetical protein